MEHEDDQLYSTSAEARMHGALLHSLSVPRAQQKLCLYFREVGASNKLVSVKLNIEIPGKEHLKLYARTGLEKRKDTT